jgi:hypothetical protein
VCPFVVVVVDAVVVVVDRSRGRRPFAVGRARSRSFF